MNGNLQKHIVNKLKCICPKCSCWKLWVTNLFAPKWEKACVIPLEIVRVKGGEKETGKGRMLSPCSSAKSGGKPYMN